MSNLLKNGGWRGVGEFVTIRKTVEIGGQTVQICSFHQQLDEQGVRRSRDYYELRTRSDVVLLDPATKSLRAAQAAAERRFAK